MNRPWLSVIIPTYNGESYLSSALGSILLQNDVDIEVIAIDDGSTDGTLDILKTYIDRLPMKVVCREHCGNWTSNTNLGMSAAQGQYLCWLHQDDTWCPTRLSRLRIVADRWPDAVMIFHPCWLTDSTGRRLVRWRTSVPRYDSILQPNELLERLIIQNFIATSAPIFKSEAIAQIGMLDESLWYSGDWEFWLRLGRHGAAVCHSEPLSSFRIHPRSQTSTRSAQVEELRKQYQIVLERHLPACRAAASHGTLIDKVAMFSAFLNIELARLRSRGGMAVGQLLRDLVALGPHGWYRFLRDSTIIERCSGRIYAEFRLQLQNISIFAMHNRAPRSKRERHVCDRHE